MAAPDQPESPPNSTTAPSDVTYPLEPDAEEGWWQVIDRQLHLAVADRPVHDSVEDLGPSSEGNGSRRSTERGVTDDGEGGSGYTPSGDREVATNTSLTEVPDSELVSCDNDHSVNSAQNFCPVCGVPMATGSLRRCSKCGADSASSASFCAECGDPLSVGGATPAPGRLTPTTGTAPRARAVRAKGPRNPLSVWSVALLLLGTIGALVAIPMGFVARRQIRASHGRQRGAGLALAAIVIGFVFVGTTVVVGGLVLRHSGPSGGSGPSLFGLTSTVKAQIAGNGSDSLKVPGVASVVCDPPNSWRTGEHFTCTASGSTGSTIGSYDGTVEPDPSPGKYQWNASWHPG